MPVCNCLIFSRNHILEKVFIFQWMRERERLFFNGENLHFYIERFLFTCFDGRKVFKKTHTVGGMLPTGGNPAVGRKILMHQSFALIFCFNYLCLIKYLWSNNQKMCYNTLFHIRKIQFSV